MRMVYIVVSCDTALVCWWPAVPQLVATTQVIDSGHICISLSRATSEIV